tara:strand:- start:647 stop:880 length:234 start_codon:yes stop_codon:yes gene_type:complete
MGCKNPFNLKQNKMKVPIDYQTYHKMKKHPTTFFSQWDTIDLMGHLEHLESMVYTTRNQYQIVAIQKVLVLRFLELN